MVAWQVVGLWLVNATHAEGESEARRRLALTGGGTPGEAGVASPLRSPMVPSSRGSEALLAMVLNIVKKQIKRPEKEVV